MAEAMSAPRLRRESPTLDLDRVLRRAREFLRGERLVVGLAELDLERDADTEPEALLVGIDDLPVHRLDVPLVPPERDARREVRKELHPRRLVLRPRLRE